MAKTRVRALFERFVVAAAFAVILSIALFAHGDRSPTPKPYVVAAPSN